jgi:hypothetical protein
MRFLSLALSLAVAVFAPIHPRANPCSSRDFAERVAKLPAFIRVSPGTSPKDALAQALGCDPPAPPKLRGGQPVNPDKLVGHGVFSQEGRYLGTVKGTVVNRDTGAASSLVDLASEGGRKTVAVALSKISLDEGSLATGDLEKAPTVAIPLQPDSDFVVSFFFATPVICRFGLSEYCDRVDTEITSKPTGATVYFDGQSSGTTEIRALLRSTDVKSLRIELAGYKPCRFEDGTYQGGNGDSYATFNCELKSLR